MKNSEFETQEYISCEQINAPSRNYFNHMQFISKNIYVYSLISRLIHRIYMINEDFKENMHILCRRFFNNEYIESKNIIMFLVENLSEYDNDILDQFLSYAPSQDKSLTQIAVDIIKLSRSSGIKFLDKYEKPEDPDDKHLRELKFKNMEDERMYSLMNGETPSIDYQEVLKGITARNKSKINKNRPHKNKDTLLSNLYVIEEILLDTAIQAAFIKISNQQERDEYVISLSRVQK